MPMPIETRAHMICTDIRQILRSYPALADALDGLEMHAPELEQRIANVVTAGLRDFAPG